MKTGFSEMKNNSMMFTNVSKQVSVSADQTFKTTEILSVTTNDLRKFIDNILNMTGELDIQSSKIHDIVDVVQSIADNTNLLSINAGIVAARAGEQGKAFSVVSKEVTDLASQTGHALKNIRNQIESLRKMISRMTGLVDTSIEKIQHGCDIISNMTGDLQGILLSIQIVQSSGEQIESLIESNDELLENIINVISTDIHRELSPLESRFKNLNVLEENSWIIKKHLSTIQEQISNISAKIKSV